MKLKIEFNYTKIEIPYRCRLPRPVKYTDGEIEVTIPEVKISEAPVAIILKDHHYVTTYVENPTDEQIEMARGRGEKNYDDKGNYYRLYPSWPSTLEISRVVKVSYEQLDEELRWWGGRFWQKWSDGHCSGEPGSDLGEPGSDPRVTWRDHRDWNPNSRDQQEADIVSYYSNMIIIDGQTYRQRSEPMLVVMTFGLGCNHGGTALMMSYSYNSNISYSRYYNLLQLEEAATEAERIATARGDTKNIPMHRPKFEVLLPEAIKADPANDYGGAGDSFINQVESVIEVAQNPTVSGAIGMMMAFNGNQRFADKTNKLLG